jgi:hypothetical protein
MWHLRLFSEALRAADRMTTHPASILPAYQIVPSYGENLHKSSNHENYREWLRSYWAFA